MNYHKYIKVILPFATSIMAVSCQVDSGVEDFQTEMPDGMKEVYYLTKFDELKAYISPDFHLGTSVDVLDYNNSASTLKFIANSNFTEVTAPTQLKHGRVIQNNGDANTIEAEKFAKNLASSNMTLFGESLLDYKDQNGKMLNQIISPVFVESEEGVTEVVSWDEYIFNGAYEGGPSPQIGGWVPDGYMQYEATCGVDGSGGLHFSKLVEHPNNWQGQVQIYNINDFVTPLEEGESDTYILSFDVRTDQPFAFPPVSVVGDNGGTTYNDIFVEPSDITTEWQTVQCELIVTPGHHLTWATQFNLQFGNIAADIYFDNFSFRRKKIEYVGGEWVEKTAEEKKQILSDTLRSYVDEVVTATKGVAKAWTLVSEPLDPADYSKLRSNGGVADEDEKVFYWNDYMGDDYPLVAQQAAAAIDPDVKFFVQESNLLDPAKMSALLDRIAKWEAAGIKIDGISAEVNLSYDLSEGVQSGNEAAITKLLESLAQSGKLIRITGLDMSLANSGVEAMPSYLSDHYAMSDYYKFMIDSYLNVIPVNQQWGISKNNLVDSDGSIVGLWDKDLNRKHTYLGFIEGLGYKE